MGFFFNKRKSAQVPAEYLEQQITMAITNLQGRDNKPEISLLIGVLKKADNAYEINMNNGKSFKLPSEWLEKIKLMDEKVKGFLGNSKLLLSVTNVDMKAKGFSYQTDINGSIDIQVRK